MLILLAGEVWLAVRALQDSMQRAIGRRSGRCGALALRGISHLCAGHGDIRLVAHRDGRGVRARAHCTRGFGFQVGRLAGLCGDADRGLADQAGVAASGLSLSGIPADLRADGPDGHQYRTPVVEAGLTDHAWIVEELVGVLKAREKIAA